MSRLQRLMPAITLQEILPAEAIFCVRGSFQGFGWSAPNPMALDRSTVGSVTLGGGATILCSRAAATDLGLRLLESAGLPCCAPLLTYADANEFAGHVKTLMRDGKKLAYQTAHALRERPAASYFVPRRLLTYLNDKGNLAELVPSDYVPHRHIVPLEDLTPGGQRFRRFPLVFKAVSTMPSASGQAVVIAKNDSDIARVRDRFHACRFVVVEEFLDIRRNFCLNFATTHDGPRFIGAGLQVTDPNGGYHGNWLGPELQPSLEAMEVGMEIMRRACACGYCGFAGFDMTVDSRQKIHVIDLNFRINGSTAAVIWQNAVKRRFGEACVSRVLRLTMRGCLADFERPIMQAIRDGVFLPLGFFDTAVYEGKEGDSSVTALVVGHSRRIVEHRVRALSRVGLCADAVPSGIDSAGRPRAMPRNPSENRHRNAA